MTELEVLAAMRAELAPVDAIYRLHAPQESSDQPIVTPHVVWSREILSNEPMHGFSCPADTQAVAYRVDCFALDYDQVRWMSQSVQRAFLTFDAPTDGAFEDWDEKTRVYRVTLSFLSWEDPTAVSNPFD